MRSEASTIARLIPCNGVKNSLLECIGNLPTDLTIIFSAWLGDLRARNFGPGWSVPSTGRSKKKIALEASWRATIERLIESPISIPSGLVVTKGWMIVFATSAATPVPNRPWRIQQHGCLWGGPYDDRSPLGVCWFHRIHRLPLTGSATPALSRSGRPRPPAVSESIPASISTFRCTLRRTHNIFDRLSLASAHRARRRTSRQGQGKCYLVSPETSVWLIPGHSRHTCSHVFNRFKLRHYEKRSQVCRRSSHRAAGEGD